MDDNNKHEYLRGEVINCSTSKQLRDWLVFQFEVEGGEILNFQIAND